jgi:hypothetical protein
MGVLASATHHDTVRDFFKSISNDMIEMKEKGASPYTVGMGSAAKTGAIVAHDDMPIRSAEGHTVDTSLISSRWPDWSGDPSRVRDIAVQHLNEITDGTPVPTRAVDQLEDHLDDDIRAIRAVIDKIENADTIDIWQEDGDIRLCVNGYLVGLLERFNIEFETNHIQFHANIRSKLGLRASISREIEDIGTLTIYKSQGLTYQPDTS